MIRRRYLGRGGEEWVGHCPLPVAKGLHVRSPVHVQGPPQMLGHHPVAAFPPAPAGGPGRPLSAALAQSGQGCAATALDNAPVTTEVHVDRVVARAPGSALNGLSSPGNTPLDGGRGRPRQALVMA